MAELVHLKPRLLHPIQHRSQEAQADLSWIRAREALVESRTQMINTIRGMTKAFGERLRKCSVESFTAKRAEQIPAAIRGAVVPLLEMIDGGMGALAISPGHTPASRWSAQRPPRKARIFSDFA